MEKPNYSSQSASSKEDENLLSQLKEMGSHESVKLTVNSEQFLLPFTSREKSTLVLENNNNFAVCFNVCTNSPEILEIDPKIGCIGSGEEVFLTLKHPKVVSINYLNEILVFKIKYCIHCNSNVNSRIGPNHDRASQGVNSFEKNEEVIYEVSCPIQDGRYSKCSKKILLRPKKSYEIIRQNFSAFKQAPKQFISANHPKSSQHQELIFSDNEFNSIDQDYLKPGLYRKEICEEKILDDYKDMKIVSMSRYKLYSMPIITKLCEKERFESHCFKYVDCNHLCPYYYQNEDNDLSIIRWKCSDKKECQQIEHCTSPKSESLCSGHTQERLKSCINVPICPFKTCCSFKDNIYSSKRNVQDDRHVNCKIEKFKNADLPDKEFNICETIDRKPFKICYKCSRNFKRNRKMMTTDVSRRQKIKHIGIPAHRNDRWLFLRSCLKKIIWFTAFILITCLLIFAISIIVVQRKESSIVETPSEWERYFPVAKIFRCVTQPEEIACHDKNNQ